MGVKAHLAQKINILNHTLVPKHRILSEKEVKEILDNYNISKIQLPEISQKDPVVVAIKAKQDDILEIIRQGASGKEKYYRRVVQ